MSSQTLDRALSLLRLLAASPQGSRLVDLQQQTGLTKPTVHRLLDALCQHDLAAKDDESRRYRIGAGIAMLAGSAPRPAYDLRELCQDHMLEVAQRTGDTSFLTIRSGYDAICIDRQSGSYPVKAFTVDVGTRRPLGVGAGGIVLLAAMDDAGRANAYEAIAQALPAGSGLTLNDITAAVDDARRLGYAFSDGFVLAGVRGLAVPINDARGKAVAALSIAAIKERISRKRMPQLLSILQSHAASLELRIKAASGTGRP